MKIRNNTFLITGAASGLGLATAELVVREAGKVVILDINESDGKSAAIRLGKNAFFVKTDVTVEEDVQNALQLTREKFGQISGIINCAGIGPAKRVVGKEGPHPLDFFQKVIDVNLTGPFNTIRLAVNQMQHNELEETGERGIVINTSSVAAFDGQIGQAAYAASKGGLAAMTLPLAREFARMGIRVMAVAPGIFETPLLSNLPAEVQQSLGQQIPFPPRLGKNLRCS